MLGSKKDFFSVCCKTQMIKMGSTARHTKKNRLSMRAYKVYPPKKKVKMFNLNNINTPKSINRYTNSMKLFLSTKRKNKKKFVQQRKNIRRKIEPKRFLAFDGLFKGKNKHSRAVTNSVKRWLTCEALLFSNYLEFCGFCFIASKKIFQAF